MAHPSRIHNALQCRNGIVARERPASQTESPENSAANLSRLIVHVTESEHGIRRERETRRQLLCAGNHRERLVFFGDEVTERLFLFVRD